MVRGVVLVEGLSDRAALHAVARAHHLDLPAAGIEIRAMGGATNIRRELLALRTGDDQPHVTGICDVGEERYYRRAVAAAEGVPEPDRAEMRERGFFICEQDLEDELIRALTPEGVLAVVKRNNDLASFGIFANQPAQRDRPLAAQLHRFLGTRSGRKIAYAGDLVTALPPGRIPEPLTGVLDATLAGLDQGQHI